MQTKREIIPFFQPVLCECGRAIMHLDANGDLILKTRLVKVGVGESAALCRCKRLVKVPVSIQF